MMALLAGASVIYGPGMLEAGITFDLAQLVVDNELIAMTKYCRAGHRGERRHDGYRRDHGRRSRGHFLEKRRARSKECMA